MYVPNKKFLLIKIFIEFNIMLTLLYTKI